MVYKWSHKRYGFVFEHIKIYFISTVAAKQFFSILDSRREINMLIQVHIIIVCQEKRQHSKV